MKCILKTALAFLFLGLFVIKPSTSYAYWHDHGYVGIHVGVWPGYYDYDYPYYGPYYASPYYYPGYAVVASSSYQPVVINGTTYYVNNGVYYIYTQYGYQAVTPPASALSNGVLVSAAGPGPVSDDSVTVNIPNAKGGYTAVTLKKSGNGFVGPQGEFYADFPKVSQLQTMYGK